jgi:hypothetical protein
MWASQLRLTLYEEDLETNRAWADPSFTYMVGDDSVSSQADDLEVPSDGIEVVLPPAVRYPNLVSLVFVFPLALLICTTQDQPLKTWYPHTDEYLQEQLCREGQGSDKTYSKCMGVRCQDPDKFCPNRGCDGLVEFRCVDQACMGELMHCAECIVAAHAQLPTHFVEVWTSSSDNTCIYERLLLRSGQGPISNTNEPGSASWASGYRWGIHMECAVHTGKLPPQILCCMMCRGFTR